MSQHRRISPQLVRARSLQEAADLAGDAGCGARFIAGATALQLEWSRGEAPPARLVDIASLPDLDGVGETGDGGIRIGAANRLAALERHASLAPRWPLLIRTIGTIAAPSVRELATIGGNIATGTGCLVPTLLVLSAMVEFFDRDRACTLSLRGYLRQRPDRARLLTAVVLPAMPARHRAAHRKIGLRWGFTPSVIGAAGVLALDAQERIG